MTYVKIGLLGMLVAVFAVAGCSRRNKASDASNASRMAVAEFDRAGAPGSRPLPASPAARKVMKGADLTLVADDIEKTGAAIEKLVDEAGGFVLSSEYTGQRQRAKFTLALRIPADRFTAAVDAISGLGKIERKNIRGDDATDEYVDLESDLVNAQRVQERYFGLLAKAARVSDALEVERELERVGGEIERIKGRLQVIDNRVALSTVSVTIRSSVAPPLVDFGRGFIQMLRVLVRFLVIVFYCMVFLIGVAIPVVFVLYLVRFIVRSLKRKP